MQIHRSKLPVGEYLDVFLYKPFEITSKEIYSLPLPLFLMLAKGKGRCPFLNIAY